MQATGPVHPLSSAPANQGYNFHHQPPSVWGKDRISNTKAQPSSAALHQPQPLIDNVVWKENSKGFNLLQVQQSSNDAARAARPATIELHSSKIWGHQSDYKLRQWMATEYYFSNSDERDMKVIEPPTTMPPLKTPFKDPTESTWWLSFQEWCSEFASHASQNADAGPAVTNRFRSIVVRRSSDMSFGMRLRRLSDGSMVVVRLADNFAANTSAPLRVNDHITRINGLLLTPHYDVQRMLMHCGPYAIFHVGMPDPPNVPFHYDDKLELKGFIRILSDLEAARGSRCEEPINRQKELESSQRYTIDWLTNLLKTFTTRNEPEATGSERWF